MTINGSGAPSILKTVGCQPVMSISCTDPTGPAVMTSTVTNAPLNCALQTIWHLTWPFVVDLGSHNKNRSHADKRKVAMIGGSSPSGSTSSSK